MDKIQSLPKLQQDRVVVTLWDWWNTRNKVNAGEVLKSTADTCQRINKQYQEFASEERPAGLVQRPERRWEPPPAGCVKINFDALFVQENQDVAYGFAIRSDTGEDIAGGAGKLHHLRSALQGEAEVCLAAMEVTADLGFFRVIFESDCHTLITAIKQGGYELLTQASSSVKLAAYVICTLILQISFSVVGIVIK